MTALIGVFFLLCYNWLVMSEILKKLNPPQRQAVETTEGPVLVIAGAGSGKTRALTHRVAYLILEKKISPRRILAVTFTNKAASEMKERIMKLLSDANQRMNPNSRIHESQDGGIRRFEDSHTSVDSNRLPTIGTFHSVCVKILRREIEKVGYKSSFNIFDDQDQQSLMKKVMKEMQINIDQFKPKAILGAISKAKNELVEAEKFAAGAGGYWEDVVAKIYTAYQKRLKDQDALDFDDILMLTVKIFKAYPEILEKYQNFFRYIMVDEYQDTNHAQYTLVKMLSQKYRNIWVCGDDWQGVYSWRGADIQNILDFEKDYPDATVVKLEQNYRSTQTILDAAYGVISKNVNRKDKKIWTENKGGHLITSYEADNERDEAEFIISEIDELRNKENINLNSFVVLYRTNAQSRIIEEAMLRNSVPYRIIGGVKFYQRKEIKDMVAYLRLINNFNDEVSLERIINEPRRSIGGVTLAHWLKGAKEENVSPIELGLKLQITNYKLQINSKYKIQNSKLDPIAKFCEFIKRMSELKNKLQLTDLIQKVYVESGYEKFLLDGTDEGMMRHENVQELLSVAKKYDEYEAEPASTREDNRLSTRGGEGLNLFLEEIALQADTDKIDQASDAVHLMTLHSAKGLEFEYVFIAGLEEGIMPHSRSMLDPNQMEEERRLMYVGITRARKKVYLLFTMERNIYGSTQINPPSRFLEDVPEHLFESANSKSQALNSKQYQNSNDPAAANALAGKQNSKLGTLDTGYKISNTNFKDGDRVCHEAFGEGMIVASQGDVVTVAFNKVGLKKLSASIAKLKRV
ncbi:MAG: ATP-dependent helicase UvrD/PcrA [Patescibacteria group bacterium]|nr:ATP-dependent helicase UvrD/PcrA [Patescibacteria group bacterium]